MIKNLRHKYSLLLIVNLCMDTILQGQHPKQDSQRFATLPKGGDPMR